MEKEKKQIMWAIYHKCKECNNFTVVFPNKRLAEMALELNKKNFDYKEDAIFEIVQVEVDLVTT